MLPYDTVRKFGDIQNIIGNIVSLDLNHSENSHGYLAHHEMIHKHISGLKAAINPQNLLV